MGFAVGTIALIIVFQPELRRFLQMIGMRQKHFNFISRIFSTGDDKVQTNIVPIVTACREMAETKTGALIVIGQESDLRLIAEGGIALDAKISTALLKNIFFKLNNIKQFAFFLRQSACNIAIFCPSVFLNRNASDAAFR